MSSRSFGYGAALGAAKYLGRGYGYKALANVGNYISSKFKSSAAYSSPQVYNVRQVSMKKFNKKRRASNSWNVGRKKLQPSLKKRIKNLERKVADQTSTLTFRNIITEPLITTANNASYTTMSINDAAYCESVLAVLRYYDPSNPGVLITADGAVGSYERSFSMTGYFQCLVKNNYQVPVEVKIYSLKCAADTGNSPTTWMDTCLTDCCNTTKNSPQVFLSDIPDFGDLWATLGCKSFVLQPGECQMASMNVPRINYDPSEYDNHAFVYQPDMQSRSFLVRVVGGPAHDKVTTSNVGLSPGGVDVIWKRVSQVQYNAGGPKMRYVYVSSNYDAQAAGSLVSQVVVDNQEYSIT